MSNRGMDFVINGEIIGALSIYNRGLGKRALSNVNIAGLKDTDTKQKDKVISKVERACKWDLGALKDYRGIERYSMRSFPAPIMNSSPVVALDVIRGAYKFSRAAWEYGSNTPVFTIMGGPVGIHNELVILARKVGIPACCGDAAMLVERQKGSPMDCRGVSCTHYDYGEFWGTVLADTPKTRMYLQDIAGVDAMREQKMASRRRYIEQARMRAQMR